jgi:FMN reductase (NADPH)
VMIGAVRNDALETARILGLPHRVYCVFGLCLGWPGETPAQKPRMPYEAMVHYERYGALKGGTVMSEAVARYDAELAAHYRATGRRTTDDSWSHDVDAKFSVRPREALRQQLKERGFDFH